MSTKIAKVDVRLFKVPLPEVLSDAKHGDHYHFELVTATITLEDGSEGTGYTYTGGKGGHAIKAMIEHDFSKALTFLPEKSIDVVFILTFPLLFIPPPVLELLLLLISSGYQFYTLSSLYNSRLYELFIYMPP